MRDLVEVIEDGTKGEGDTLQSCRSLRGRAAVELPAGISNHPKDQVRSQGGAHCGNIGGTIRTLLSEIKMRKRYAGPPCTMQ